MSDVKAVEVQDVSIAEGAPKDDFGPPLPQEQTAPTPGTSYQRAKLTKANHVYYRRVRSILKSMGKLV